MSLFTHQVFRVLLIIIVTALLSSAAHAQQKEAEPEPRLVFFDVMVGEALPDLQSSTPLLTSVLGSQLVGLSGIEVLDQGTRDALLLQRRFNLEDCKKAECRFAMARALPGIDYMLETEIDRISKICLVTFRLKSVQQGTMVDSFFERTECDAESILEAIRSEASKVWPPGQGQSSRRGRKERGTPLKTSPGATDTPTAGTAADEDGKGTWLWLGFGPGVLISHYDVTRVDYWGSNIGDYSTHDFKVLSYDARVEAGHDWWGLGAILRSSPMFTTDNPDWWVTAYNSEARFSYNWFSGIFRAYASAGAGLQLTDISAGDSTETRSGFMGTASLGGALQKYSGLVVDLTYGYGPSLDPQHFLFFTLGTGIEPTAFIP